MTLAKKRAVLVTLQSDDTKSWKTVLWLCEICLKQHSIFLLLLEVIIGCLSSYGCVQQYGEHEKPGKFSLWNDLQTEKLLHALRDAQLKRRTSVISQQASGQPVGMTENLSTRQIHVPIHELQNALSLSSFEINKISMPRRKERETFASNTTCDSTSLVLLFCCWDNALLTGSAYLLSNCYVQISEKSVLLS